MSDAAVDELRDRVRLLPGHLSALGALVRQEPVDDDLRAYVDDLHAGGLLDGDDRAVPLVADLVRAVAAPRLHVVVESVSARGRTVGSVLVGPREDGALWLQDGWSDAPATYTREPRRQLGHALIRLAGVVARPATRRGQEVSAPARLLDSPLQAVELTAGLPGWRAVVAATADLLAGSPDVQPDDRAVLAEVWRALLGATRVTVVADPAVELVWVDAGRCGRWLRTTTPGLLDGRPDTEALLTWLAVDAGDLSAALLAAVTGAPPLEAVRRRQGTVVL